jgi:predicted ATPase
MAQIRTPDQRLRVFVSSTMKELADARAAARRAIEGLRLTPVLFELGARPYPPRDLYLAYLRQSDVFIGIYGQQYGWIAPGQQVSGLEDEYLAAADKPKLVYVEAPAPDRDPRLTQMLKRVAEGGLSYRAFGSAGELDGLIADDLALLLSDRFSVLGEASHPAPESDAGTVRRQAAGQLRLGGGRPVAGNRLIGRRSELAALGDLLADPETRLLTLVGPGGIGKTRLAMEAAASVARDYESVAVAQFDEASPASPLVISSIASALGVPETTGIPLFESVVRHIGSGRILLVLDGFERVIDTAPLIADLVSRTNHLTVLVTSRELLRLSGERVFEVLPLAVPLWSAGTDAARASESVQLFADRASAAGASLRLDDAEVRTIAEICRRLDGLPLAIELAASRARMLDLNELVERLNTSLATLTSGARDLPERQQALRSTIAWSYDLLDESDRRLFGRLGVFAGSFALDAAEVICGREDQRPVFDAISSLVDKALLRPDHSLPGQPRFGMLQVIREYAAERLADAGEADQLRQRHADLYRDLVVEAERGLRKGETRSVVDQFVADQGNIRNAMEWFLDAHDGGSVARMGLAAWPLWFTLGAYTEGTETMERALAAESTLSEDDRADTRLALGMMAAEAGDYDRAQSVLPPALDRYVEQGNERGVATAFVVLGLIAAIRSGDGEDRLRHAVDAFRRLDDPWGLVLSLLALGTALMATHREVDAIAPLAEATRIAEAIDEEHLLSTALISLGWAYLKQTDILAARERLGEALHRAMSARQWNGETIARAFDALAAVAEQTGDAQRGATLLGAAGGIRRTLGAEVWAIDRKNHAEISSRIHARLDDDTYRRLADRGAGLSLDEIVETADALTRRPGP